MLAMDARLEAEFLAEQLEEGSTQYRLRQVTGSNATTSFYRLCADSEGFTPPPCTSDNILTHTIGAV